MTITLDDPPPASRQSLGSGIPAFRRPPHNIEAEIALLGAILINNRTYERVSEFLRAEHFSVAEHGRIFAACAKLIDRNQIADPITLKAYFEQDESLADIGGPAYLMKLADSAVTVINAAEYGRIVHDLFLRRELISLGEDVVNRAYGSDIEDSATQQIELAEQSLYDLATKGEYEGGFEPFDSTLDSALRIAEAAHKREGQLSGVPTGLRDLDGKLGGLHRSDLIILAGRPSMGKTALATNMAFNAAKKYRTAKREDGGTDVVDGAVIGDFWRATRLALPELPPGPHRLDLLLLDVAAEYAGWNADMTRTIPVSGKFSPRQREVYLAVLRILRFAEKILRPGILIADYQRQIIAEMEKELIALHLFTPQQAAAQDDSKPLVKKYFMHGTSHHLGLDVHDVAPAHLPVAPGMLFNIEPRIYLPEENLGIRLENNYLIGQSENTNLMAHIPIEPDHIEALMVEHRQPPLTPPGK